MSSIRRRAGKFTFRETLDAEALFKLGFDVWEAVRDEASKRLGVVAPPLSLMGQSIRYLKVDAETGGQADVVNGEQWTHAEFTLCGTIPLAIQVEQERVSA